MGESQDHRRGPRAKLILILSALCAGIVALGGGYLFLPSSRSAPGKDAVQGIEAAEATEDFAAALEKTEKELALRPGDPSLLRSAGRLRFLIGDYQAGNSHFQALIAADPHPAAALAELATLWDEVHGFWEAFHCAEAALKADPEAPGARGLLARLQVTNNRFEEARDLLRPKVSSGKADREELLVYGEALLRLGEPAEASAILGKALAEPGSSTQHRWVRGGGSYLSVSDRRIHLGLGAATAAEHIEITWPLGKKQVLENVPADRSLKVEEPER